VANFPLLKPQNVMDIVDKLLSFFQKSEEETKNHVPEGFCPTCWNYKQYDSTIRFLLKDNQISLTNHEKARVFFEDIFEKNLEGLQLKEIVTVPCPNCNNVAEEPIIEKGKPKPIKRIKELQALSRDHHHGLLLCWKIRQGVKKNIALDRVKKYIDWFWDKHLQNHFEIEEKYIFPILGNENHLITRAKEEHLLLKKLFEDESDLSNSLEQIEQVLQNHIRFEERVVFNEIQKVVTKKELAIIGTLHNDDFKDNYEDEFWL
jgi:hypothetical protein